MGLWYDDVKKVNPSIIYAHFNGFGYEGPDAARPGFDMAAFWARSGIMGDFSFKGYPPIKPIGGMGDSTTSSLFLSGILSALIAKMKTGEGTLVSSSLYGSAIWYAATGVIAASYGNEYPKDYMNPPTPFSHSYQCKDGEWLQLTVINYDANYAKMCKLFGIEQVIDDPRFNTQTECRKNMPEFVGIVCEAFKKKTSQEWAEIFKAADVVFEKINHFADIAKDEQALANGYVKEITFKNGEKAPLPQPPVKFSAYEEKEFVVTGEVGRDTDEILAAVGYTKEEIEKAKASKGVK